MKVYVITVYYIGISKIVAVLTSKEKAEELKEKYKRTPYINSIEIYEKTLDKIENF